VAATVVQHGLHRHLPLMLSMVLLNWPKSQNHLLTGAICIRWLQLEKELQQAAREAKRRAERLLAEGDDPRGDDEQGRVG
jgi:hypothetical protein